MRDMHAPKRRAYHKARAASRGGSMVHPSIHSTSSGISTLTRPPRSRRRYAIGALALVAAMLLFAIAHCSAPESAVEEEDIALPDTGPTEGRVTFVAVGDNLPDEAIGRYADSLAGDVGDGAYDYAPIYEAMKPMIESADLAYVKQETHIGGEEIGPRGWPSFNTTDDMARAIVDTGFDLVASASNHSYDWGTYGAVEHSREVWDAAPVTFTGTAATQEQADQLATIERNGITFSLLDYTYGVNGFTSQELPRYAINLIDEERIRADVARAKEASDVVLVAMHWGTENLMEADEEQQRYAQLLADLEVDVVLGSHPHVIGPLEWVEGESGHQTLVAYSLGNFLSNHETPKLKNELEGALSCTFIRGEDGSVSIEDIVWTPLVNHTEEGYHRVIPLKDYTAELASKHRLLSSVEDPLKELSDLNASVIGEGFAIDGPPTGETAD